MQTPETAPRAPVIIGTGRVGRSIGAALSRGGIEATIRGRAEGLAGLSGEVVLLCVPDSEIAAVAAQIGETGESPQALGHTSGASALTALTGADAAMTFSLHPLQTVPDGRTDLAGSPAAVAGSGPEAVELASALARAAGMRPFEVAEEDRPLYHAAASIASNFLVTIEQTAADLLGEVTREDPRGLLEALARRSLDNWLERGPAALTGPIARGDETTVQAHRQALSGRHPGLLPLYDTLAARTEEVAGAARGNR